MIYACDRKRNTFVSIGVPLSSPPRDPSPCDPLVRNPFALTAAQATLSICRLRSLTPTRLAAWPILSAVGILSETHHIKRRIPDSPPAFLIACEPQCSLVLSPPLQKNVEVETASQHANRIEDHQSHDTSKIPRSSSESPERII